MFFRFGDGGCERGVPVTIYLLQEALKTFEKPDNVPGNHTC